MDEAAFIAELEAWLFKRAEAVSVQFEHKFYEGGHGLHTPEMLHLHGKSIAYGAVRSFVSGHKKINLKDQSNA